MKKFSIKEAITFGWETFKKQPWNIIKIFLVAGFIYIVTSSISNSLTSGGQEFNFLGFIAWLVNLGAQTVIGLGLVRVSLKLADKHQPHYSDLYSDYKKGLRYLGAALLFFLIVGGVPMILFIIAAATNSEILMTVGRLAFVLLMIFIGLRLIFYSYLIVDKNMGIVESLKKSYALTEGQVPSLILFILACIAISILGAIAVIVGLLVAIPVVMIASAHVYRKLSSHHN